MVVIEWKNMSSLKSFIHKWCLVQIVKYLAFKEQCEIFYLTKYPKHWRWFDSRWTCLSPTCGTEARRTGLRSRMEKPSRRSWSSSPRQNFKYKKNKLLQVGEAQQLTSLPFHNKTKEGEFWFRLRYPPRRMPMASRKCWHMSEAWHSVLVWLRFCSPWKHSHWTANKLTLPA